MINNSVPVCFLLARRMEDFLLGFNSKPQTPTIFLKFLSDIFMGGNPAFTKFRFDKGLAACSEVLAQSHTGYA